MQQLSLRLRSITASVIFALAILGGIASPLIAGGGEESASVAKKESAAIVAEAPKRNDAVTLQTLILVAAPAGLVILVALIRRLPATRHP